MIYYQLKMIYLPGKNDLFAKQKWFILNHKTLGTIQLFWQAVLRINHLNGSHHSQCQCARMGIFPRPVAYRPY